MQIGAVYPQTELRGDPTAVRRIGRAVEDLGFDHLLAYDHVLGAVHADRTPQLTGPYTEHDPFHDPFVMFAYLAGITERIDFATGILILPQRQTALVARQAADVDLLSGGRLRLGVGRRLEPRRVRGPRTGLPYPRRAAGGADRAAAPAVHRTRRRLLGPLRPDRPSRARAQPAHPHPDLARWIQRSGVRPGRPARGRLHLLRRRTSTTPSTPGNGCANACAASAGRSRTSARTMSALRRAAQATSRRRSMPGARQAAPTSRWSRWASAWTPSTATSTTSHRSQTR